MSCLSDWQRLYHICIVPYMQSGHQCCLARGMHAPLQAAPIMLKHALPLVTTQEIAPTRCRRRVCARYKFSRLTSCLRNQAWSSCLPNPLLLPFPTLRIPCRRLSRSAAADSSARRSLRARAPSQQPAAHAAAASPSPPRPLAAAPLTPPLGAAAAQPPPALEQAESQLLAPLLSLRPWCASGTSAGTPSSQFSPASVIACSAPEQQAANQ